MGSPIDICLVSPVARASSTTVPVALLYLHAWLKKCGAKATIVDIKAGGLGIPLSRTQIEQVKSKAIDTILQLQPKIVGVPCYTPEFWDVIDFCTRIRQKHACTIIVGGLHATIKPLDFCYEGTPVDALVIGDAQRPLEEIAARVKSGQNLQGIKGVVIPGQADQTIPSPAVFEDWGSMPMPDYSQLNMDFYTRPHTGIIRNVVASGIHIFTTIGCPFSCTFCANNSRKVRFRPIPQVIEEIAFLKKRYRIDSFYVLDDTFLIKKERVHEFVKGLRERSINLMWGMETRVNLLDEETTRLIQDAGCIQIDFGVESGSQESLNRMKKGITTGQIIKAFALCKKYRIRTLANYMFNTPGENKEDVEQTVAMIQRTKPTRLSVCLTVPFPGTSIYDEYVKPPFSKEEYKIYNSKYLYVHIADPRFSMARHDLDLVGLRLKIVAGNNGFRNLVDLTLNPVYWKTLAASGRKWQYVVAYTKGILLIVAEKTQRSIKIFRERITGK